MFEQTLIWSFAIALVLAIWLPFAWSHRRRVRADEERKAEATRLRIDRPAGQYPYIDPLRCVGCSACVDACPEGDVLGMVGGTAVIVNGLRCIGIAECEKACPVGAITVGLGDVRSRADMPLLDDDLQTNLPGVFIAGELGGLSLVSNAVRQGRAVIEHVRERIDRGITAKVDGVLDLAIVGAGPAGLSAGLAAQTNELDYVILERERTLGGTVLNYPRRKMVLTQPVRLPPWGVLSATSYQKEDLLAFFEQLVREADLCVRFGEAVEKLEARDAHYVLETGEATYRARHVLLALGRRGHPRKLGVPGEEQAKVVYRLIDADSYRDAKVLVVGGGDSAVEAAIALARDGSNEVTLSYRRERLVRVKRKNQEALDDLLARGRLRTLFSSEVEAIGSGVVSVSVLGGEVVDLPNDFVFVLIGGEPPFELLRRLGVRFGGESTTEPVAQRESDRPVEAGRAGRG